MKTRIRQAAIAALATGLVAGTLQSATLRGRVRTADGEALKARVTVLARSSGVNLTTYDTGEDGTFSIDLPATGAVAASASAAGYSSHEIDLTDGAPSGSVTFTLEALREMRGTVRDGDGNAVGGARVRVGRIDTTQRIGLAYGREDVTASDGGFAVMVPKGSGRYVIDAIADGWVPQSSGVLGSGSVGSTGVGDGTARSVLVSLELEGASVSGTVTSPSGSVLSGITVLAGVEVRHPTADDSLVPGGITGPGTGQIRPYGRSFRARTTADS